MKKIRYFVRLTLAFLKRFKGLLLLGTIFGILSFFVIRFASSAFFYRGSEVIGIPGRYTPETLPESILNLIADGLTSIDQNGIVAPSLARSWETKDDGKTWVFYLKEGIYWHDGEPLTSKSVIYEFSDVSIEKPDNLTLIFKLKNPFSPYPSVVSKPTFRKGLIGTDKWRVKKIVVSGGFVQKLTIVDNDKNKITYRFYPTEDRAKLAFKLGEVDKLYELFNPKPFLNWNTASITSLDNSNEVVTIFFNTKDPVLSDKSLRQALSYSIDKDTLSDSRAFSPINPNSWAYNPLVKKYNLDLQRASELQEEVEEGLKTQTIKLVTSPILLEEAEKIASDWRKIGINTLVQVSSIIPSQFQAYLTILDIPKDPDQYSLWHSTQTSTNISGLSNPRIDKLLEDGRSQLAFEERKKIYLDFQRFLLEDPPAVFLFHPRTFSVSRN